MNLKLMLSLLLLAILSSCNTGYQKENGKWVWIQYDSGAGKRVRTIEQHDAESFKVLKNKHYAIDKNAVFYLGRKVPFADPNSFTPIKKTGYAKDKKRVFLDDALVIHADPSTFKILEFPFAKDANKIFCGTIPLSIPAEEMASFKVTGSDKFMASMKTSSMTSHFIKMHPEYEWIDSLNIKVVITGQFATAETSKRKFKGVREIKD
ncbi:MAG: DKNYY domain-containing protein [Bacteroidota bacterium]